MFHSIFLSILLSMHLTLHSLGSRFDEPIRSISKESPDSSAPCSDSEFIGTPKELFDQQSGFVVLGELRTVLNNSVRETSDPVNDYTNETNVAYSEAPPQFSMIKGTPNTVAHSDKADSSCASASWSLSTVKPSIRHPLEISASIDQTNHSTYSSFFCNVSPELPVKTNSRSIDNLEIRDPSKESFEMHPLEHFVSRPSSRAKQLFDGLSARGPRSSSFDGDSSVADEYPSTRNLEEPRINILNPSTSSSMLGKRGARSTSSSGIEERQSHSIDDPDGADDDPDWTGLGESVKNCCRYTIGILQHPRLALCFGNCQRCFGKRRKSPSPRHSDQAAHSNSSQSPIFAEMV